MWRGRVGHGSTRAEGARWCLSGRHRHESCGWPVCSRRPSGPAGPPDVLTGAADQSDLAPAPPSWPTSSPALGIVALAVLLYAVLATQSRVVALVALGWWMMEALFMAISTVGALGLVPLGQGSSRPVRRWRRSIRRSATSCTRASRRRPTRSTCSSTAPAACSGTRCSIGPRTSRGASRSSASRPSSWPSVGIVAELFGAEVPLAALSAAAAVRALESGRGCSSRASRPARPSCRPGPARRWFGRASGVAGPSRVGVRCPDAPEAPASYRSGHAGPQLRLQQGPARRTVVATVGPIPPARGHDRQTGHEPRAVDKPERPRHHAIAPLRRQRTRPSPAGSAVSVTARPPMTVIPKPEHDATETEAAREPRTAPCQRAARRQRPPGSTRRRQPPMRRQDRGQGARPSSRTPHRAPRSPAARGTATRIARRRPPGHRGIRSSGPGRTRRHASQRVCWTRRARITGTAAARAGDEQQQPQAEPRAAHREPGPVPPCGAASKGAWRPTTPSRWTSAPIRRDTGTEATRCSPDPTIATATARHAASHGTTAGTTPTL